MYEKTIYEQLTSLEQGYLFIDVFFSWLITFMPGLKATSTHMAIKYK